jgi:type IV secretory pathway TraG/TraD family ATPase VirD4
MKREIIHLDGGQFFTGKKAVKEAQKELSDMKHSGYSVEIGGIKWTNDRTSKHFIVVGQTGGGKTTVIKPLIRHAIDKGDLVIVYDNKTEFTGILEAQKGKRTVILGPWDRRGAYWDLAKDLRSEQDAKQFASSIIKTEQGKDSIFSLGGKAIITGALVYLMKTKPQKWMASDLFKLINKPVAEFADLVKPQFSEIEALLSFDDKGQPVVATMNMMQNAVSYINPLLKALMASEKAKQRISIRAFLDQLKSGEIKTQLILLQGNKQFSEIQGKIYTGFLDIASSVINSPSFPERKPDELGVWFILDEFVQLQRLNNIKAVAEIGRSKGARLVLGFQDYAQLEEAYGRDTAKVLFGICQTHIFTKLSPESAQNISKIIGDRVIAIPNCSYESEQGKPYLKIQYQEKGCKIVEPFDFGALKGDKKGVGLILFFGTNVYKIRQNHLKFEEVRKQYIPQAWTGDRLDKPKKKTVKRKNDLADLLNNR